MMVSLGFLSSDRVTVSQQLVRCVNCVNQKPLSVQTSHCLSFPVDFQYTRFNFGAPRAAICLLRDCHSERLQTEHHTGTAGFHWRRSLFSCPDRRCLCPELTIYWTQKLQKWTCIFSRNNTEKQKNFHPGTKRISIYLCLVLGVFVHSLLIKTRGNIVPQTEMK